MIVHKMELRNVNKVKKKKMWNLKEYNKIVNQTRFLKENSA